LFATPKSKPKSIICIIGPTASGKSQLALELCRKNLFYRPEIISMDSAQIYKSIDIATAKPNKFEQNEIKHHLIDICDPKESYSVNQFIEDTLKILTNIENRKGTSIIVGGTMMYFHRLINGIHSFPAIPSYVRDQISNEGKKNGWPYLHKKLSKIDGDLANRISPFDSQRIQRGLEVWKHTGKSLSDWINSSKIKNKNFNFRFKTIALVPKDRSTLHEKIKLRFNTMIRNGLIEEVLELKKREDLSPLCPAIKIVGVRQTWDYLETKGSKDDLIFKGIAATRQLAKRQLTWIRSFKNINEIDSNAIDLNQIISICEPSS
jgi:tRNA dimethylallyltransferase